jgi:hypothetical protein
MKYEVLLENYAPLFATVTVFAGSPEEAEGKAMQMDSEGLVTWETSDFACYSGTAVELEDYQEVTDDDEIASIESFYKIAHTNTKGD